MVDFKYKKLEIKIDQSKIKLYSIREGLRRSNPPLVF